MVCSEGARVFSLGARVKVMRFIGESRPRLELHWLFSVHCHLYQSAERPTLIGNVGILSDMLFVCGKDAASISFICEVSLPQRHDLKPIDIFGFRFS